MDMGLEEAVRELSSHRGAQVIIHVGLLHRALEPEPEPERERELEPQPQLRMGGQLAWRSEVSAAFGHDCCPAEQSQLRSPDLLEDPQRRLPQRLRFPLSRPAPVRAVAPAPASQW